MEKSMRWIGAWLVLLTASVAIVALWVAAVWAAGFPSSSVVAFDSGICPVGWEPYTRLDGRVIVGSGDGREFGETGGRATMQTGLGSVEFSNTPATDRALLSDSGMHDNMPPYMVLTYCRRA